MYRIGTGDCFALKFFKGNAIKLRMMIDGGVWQKGKDHVEPFVKDLKKYLGDEIDVLVVTHEHMDHVLAFQRCKDLFTKDFKIKQCWLGWPEEDGDPKVEEWKELFGEKKKALAMAAHTLNMAKMQPNFEMQFDGGKFKDEMLGIKKNHANVIEEFAELNTDFERLDPDAAGNRLSMNKVYKGALEGMRIVKEDMEIDGFKYFKPGHIIKDLPNVPGVKFYVLGPPELHKDVKLEHGEDGETFDHSHNLEDHNAFSDAIAMKNQTFGFKTEYPFDEKYVWTPPKDLGNMKESERERSEKRGMLVNDYLETPWRKIDYDWLYSSGNLALRMNSLTNNLSLALAIEFEETGEVLLFPGDAEYGSWASWHTIDWGNEQDPNKKHLTEDLLNRTVFYKVAHHMSHNGTARTKGLDMMTNPKLTAMCTLDYDVISPGWKNTMPNKFILEELLLKTKGRVIFTNEKDIKFGPNTTLSQKITAARGKMDSQERAEFEDNLEPKPAQDHGLFYEYTIRFKS